MKLAPVRLRLCRSWPWRSAFSQLTGAVSKQVDDTCPEVEEGRFESDLLEAEAELAASPVIATRPSIAEINRGRSLTRIYRSVRILIRD